MESVAPNFHQKGRTFTYSQRDTNITISLGDEKSAADSFVETLVNLSSKSIMIFDKEKKLVLNSNKFGSWDELNTDLSSLDIESVFQYALSFFENAETTLKIVEEVYQNYFPQQFNLIRTKDKALFNCKCYPAFGDGGFAGVIITTELQEPDN